MSVQIRSAAGVLQVVPYAASIDEGNQFYPNQLDFESVYGLPETNGLIQCHHLIHHERCVIRSIDRVHRRFEG